MITTIVATAILAVGQQGGGGFGGGGFGGGGMGGAGGRSGNIGDTETTKTHILTPGDKAEWPLEMKVGDVLILKAASTNFDPAITVVDDKNVKLAENDDEEPGMQNARVLVYFPKAGNFKALVSNYRSNAGGQYTFSMQRFTAIDGLIGTPTSWKSETESATAPAVRIRCEAGKVVAFKTKNGYFRQVIGPNGTVVEYLRDIQNRFGVTAFKAESAGDYYIQTQLSNRNEPLEVRPSLAHERTVGVESQTNSQLADGDLDIWRIPVKKGELIQIESRGKLAAPIKVEDATFYESMNSEADGKWIASSSKRDERIAMIVAKDHTVTAYVGSSTGDRSYQFVCSKPWKAIAVGSSQSNRLAVGATDYYALDLKAGDILTLSGSSDTFDAMIYVVSPSGNLWSFDDDVWPSTDPNETLSISESGRYYVGMTSNGSGGGGAYELKVTAIPAKQITIGQSNTGSPKTAYDSVWDVTVPNSKPLVIRLTGDVREGNWIMLDSNGKPAFPQEIRLSDTDRMFIMVKPAAGKYRLWLRGMKIGGNYTIKVDEFK